MRLSKGRVNQMVKEAKKNDTAIVCHKTLDGDNAVCRGFFDNHNTVPLSLAVVTNRVIFVNPEKS
jgi:hypothetical protein